MDDDYTLTPCGTLGGQVGVSQSGQFLGQFPEMDEALAFVREHMDGAQYWPDIWWVSDHGNAWQIDLDGNEIQDSD